MAGTSFLKQLKYRYYVTLPLYIMTRTERCILNVFFIISLSMLFAGFYMYFPSHVKFMAQRAYYYYSGAVAVASRSVNEHQLTET
ncbi:hypothetical protein V1512DRAFT_265497 [Lipomyces arxii]|uniref:uncharacterized protein n=1 Tax=Lipomyces arxii TaxID=56418 RepID=UPI0034CD1514